MAAAIYVITDGGIVQCSYEWLVLVYRNHPALKMNVFSVSITAYPENRTITYNCNATTCMPHDTSN